MPFYYFDFRDNDEFVLDDIGAGFSSLEEVRIEASRALAEMAKDVLPGSIVRILSVEVRTDIGPLLRVSLRFEVEQLMELEPPLDETRQVQQYIEHQRAIAETLRPKLN
jgi:hypothetical protein